MWENELWSALSECISNDNNFIVNIGLKLWNCQNTFNSLRFNLTQKLHTLQSSSVCQMCKTYDMDMIQQEWYPAGTNGVPSNLWLAGSRCSVKQKASIILPAGTDCKTLHISEVIKLMLKC